MASAFHLGLKVLCLLHLVSIVREANAGSTIGACCMEEKANSMIGLGDSLGIQTRRGRVIHNKAKMF